MISNASFPVWCRWVGIAGGFSFAAGFSLDFIREQRQDHMWVGVMLLMWGGMFMVLTVPVTLIRRWHSDAKATAMAAAWLSIGRCPSCGYDLRHTLTNEGRWRCPECGGIWVAEPAGARKDAH